MTQASAKRRGFSLVEMLLAIFILGIGVISIASLFPAGIALQRQATDDVVGPIVAKNALATIRSKLSQSDFGSFQDFALQPTYNGSIAGTFQTRGGLLIPQVPGDWCWMRPGFLFDAANAGTVDVFSSAYTREQLGIGSSVSGIKASEIADGLSSPSATLFGLPYNPKRYPLYLRPDAASLDPLTQRLLEPAVTFTQAERAWPQAGSSSSGGAPQYYWDCMFRRSGGRVQVAVFVYRVAAPGGEPRGYAVSRSDTASLGSPLPAGAMDVGPNTPPLPLVYYAPNPGNNAANTATSSWPIRPSVGPAANGVTSRLLADEIPYTGPATPFFQAGKAWDDWMAPGQWWIDNHGNVHTVTKGRLVAGAAAATSTAPNQGPVKLSRQIPIMPRAPIYGVLPNVGSENGAQSLHSYISAIWFIPNTDRLGNVITPVYATVEEL